MSRNPANCQILLDPLKDGAGLFGCELVIDDSELLNQDANTRRSVRSLFNYLHQE
jgi:hypothetical protein